MANLSIECPTCSSMNKVELADVQSAACAACGNRLVEEKIPESITPPDIQEALKKIPAADAEQVRNVDVGVWVSKIGDEKAQQEYVDKGFWDKVKKYASKVPFARDAVALYFCARDSETPIAAKATAVAALAYWILPVDLIPDFIPVAGFADDAAAVYFAIKKLRQYITDAHYAKADEFFGPSRE